MDLSSVVDFVNNAHDEIGKFRFEITLSPDKLMAEDYGLEHLTWNSVLYGPEGVNEVPDDCRGVYAFAICHENNVLPPSCCILYVGIAGRSSDRALRDRYKDYLNTRKVIKRERIARMIGTWHKVLRFYFASVGDDVSSDDLQELERQLNSALLPVFSRGDLDAATRRKVRAFR